MARGDHLFYYRAGSTYSHHGICCGDGTVVHYESSLWQKLAGRASQRTPSVKRVTMPEFSLGSPVTVRTYDLCDIPESVVARALSRVGEANYDLLRNNCEHFAVWCKTGQAHSTQVDAHKQATRAVARRGAVAWYLLQRAQRVPAPYRGFAYAASAALAGSLYLGTYLAHRQSHRKLRHS